MPEEVVFKYLQEQEENACGGVGGEALGITELPASATHEVKRAAACQTDEGVKPSREVHRVSFFVGNKKPLWLEVKLPLQASSVLMSSYGG